MEKLYLERFVLTDNAPLAVGSLIYSIFYNFLPDLFGINIVTTINQEATSIFNALIAPAQAVAYSIPSNEQPILKPSISEVTHILVVEDNMDMSNYLNSILSEEHDVHFVQDGQQALNFLKNNRPDLIISDYMMPNMDGLELLNQLRSNNDYAKIPVIMLTAQQALDIKLDALRIGVDDYLTKPFDNRELTIRVNNILNNQSIIKAEQEATETKEETPKMNLEDLAWLEELEKTALKYVYNMDFSVNQLADEMAVSYSTLFARIKKLTGLTPNQYLKELRLQEARRLLEIKKYSSVKAVSYSVGYRDVKHFSKNFKKRFGKNPSAYLQ